jgi:hypothetical protein
MARAASEGEWRTRKRLIDPRLDACGWPLGSAESPGNYRLEELETDAGPADYTLQVNRDTLGIVEAKKLSLGPQNVLTQAERYSRGLADSRFNFDGFRAPFLYSTNGEVIWFCDVRSPKYRSRRVASFHTPAALQELLVRDVDGDCRRLGLPVLDFAIVAVDEVDEIPFVDREGNQTGQAQPGPAFITRDESGETWSGDARQLAKLANPQDVGRLLVFDTWLLNCERHSVPRGDPQRERVNRNNVFLSEEAPEGQLLLRAFDHTHCFTCGRAWTDKLAGIDNV